MAIYDRPTKSLMADWAKEYLSSSKVFNKSQPAHWFSQHYPKIKRNTVHMHVEGMSTNSRNRKHHPNIRPGSGHDLFYKLGPDEYRLWDKDTDPEPLYKDTLEAHPPTNVDVRPDDEADEENNAAASTAFAFERDLRNYLARNLSIIEPGLQLYDEEGISGEEFPVGGRFIDILAVDKAGGYVVIELKVSRAYDRVMGQLLRYMAWVEQNMEPADRVRGIIVAREITQDLKLAASKVADIRLIEYSISFALRPV